MTAKVSLILLPLSLSVKIVLLVQFADKDRSLLCMRTPCRYQRQMDCDSYHGELQLLLRCNWLLWASLCSSCVSFQLASST